MLAYLRRRPQAWLALVLLALNLATGCAHVAPAPEPLAATQGPTIAAFAQRQLTHDAPESATPAAEEVGKNQADRSPPGPRSNPGTLPTPDAESSGPTGDPARDELEANMSLHTWIEALETGNVDLGRYVFRLEGGATSDDILGHIVALQRFIDEAENSSTISFGTSLGFHEITGNYPDNTAGRRVGIALLQFERAVICFKADLARVYSLWSIERWEPIRWAACQAEIERLPPWVREEWRAAITTQR